uniref:PPM-type phosphatase domain-containing protein n=1 Tax=Timema bartmani TaxID=61472 RepID=A0A7R9F4S2_9NEOP|nr:unnamed protein product [Timema bartmani]
MAVKVRSMRAGLPSTRRGFVCVLVGLGSAVVAQQWVGLSGAVRFIRRRLMALAEGWGLDLRVRAPVLPSYRPGPWGSGLVGLGLAFRAVNPFRAPVLIWTISSAWAGTWVPPLVRMRSMLLGVFDGHGGPSCAHVVAKRLLQYIAACLLPPDVLSKYLQSLENNEDIMILKTYNDQIDLVDELKELYKTNFRKFVKELSETKSQREFQMKEAMEQAFLRLDDDISREALTKQGTGPEINLKTLSVTMSGAVACVVHIDGPHLHVASVGDCQAVLGVLSDVNTWMAKKLSIEHNTDNSAEVNRILAEHPSNERDTIIRMDRLLGQLAPLRALGDQRYKWSKATLSEVAVPYFGEKTIPPNYYTPPYLTARPDVTQHRLTPRDKFLVIASDGLWDMVSPLQVVRLVGEHMSGKVTLNPFKLPRKNMRIADINKLLLQRKEGLKKKPIDTNAATHLLRNALGGTEYGIDHGKLSHLLSLPDELVRLFRDDITVTVVYFDSEYLRHSPA